MLIMRSVEERINETCLRDHHIATLSSAPKRMLISPARSRANSEVRSASSGPSRCSSIRVVDVTRTSAAPLSDRHSSAGVVAGFTVSSAFDHAPYAAGSSPHLPLEWDTQQLTSPERWGRGMPSNQTNQSRVSSTISATNRSTNAGNPTLASCLTTSSPSMISSQGPLGTSYMKVYDYGQPQVATQVHQSPKTVTFASDDGTRDDNDGDGDEDEGISATVTTRRGFRPIGRKVAVSQELASGQRRREEEEARLRAKTSASSPRKLLYEGLPYTWRDLVPFQCPVRYPELMSYDATSYHSEVARQCRDSGMRLIDLKKSATGRRFASLEGLDLNVERGVVGLSLRKHSVAYRMQTAETYPGVSFNGFQNS